jgi:hypothetical protein
VERAEEDCSEEEISFIRAKVGITHTGTRYHLCVTHDDIPQTSSKAHQRYSNCSKERLEDAVSETLPCRPSLDLLALAVDEVPVELTATGIDIHLSGPKPTSTLPEIADDPEQSNNEQRKIGGEEVFSSSEVLANGRDSRVKL